MDIETLKRSLEECRQRCLALENEKSKLISDFEDKRAKFKDIYQSKEKLISDQALELESVRVKLQQNEEKVKELNFEIKDMKIIATVSENTKQEAVDNLEKGHQQEMESLRKAMEESNDESQREMVRHFERERRQWEKHLSTMKHDKEATEMQLDEVRKKMEHDAKYSEELELEASMRKALEEAENLKSVVLPLENEIAKLKSELETTKKDLEESRNVAVELNAKAAKVDEKDFARQDVTSQGQSATVLELDHSLKSELHSRVNLERDIQTLEDQKRESEHTRDSLVEKLKNIHKQFEQEKAEHAVLKETWLAANDQFLEAQRLLMRDNNIIESVLSEEQRRQVKMLKLKAQASEAREAKSPMSSMALLKSKTDKFKEVVADSVSQHSEAEESDTQSFGSFQEFSDGADSTGQRKSSVKITLAEPKPIIIENEPDYTEANAVVPAPGQKVVSELEWEDMIREIRMLRNKASRTSNTGSSLSTPGQKHADLFDDDQKMTKQIELLSTKLKAYEEDKTKELERTKSLEESIRYSAEDAQKQMTELTNKLIDFERLVGNLKEKQIKTKAEDINNMLKLTKEKDKYRDELLSSKKDRQRLAELHEKHHHTLLKETSMFSKSPEHFQNMLAAYRKALASTRAEKDNLETKLKGEIGFMEERLKAEQSSRDQLESSLASELHDARGEIIALRSLESVKEELEKAKEEKSVLEERVEKSKTSFEALQSKSSEIIKGLRAKHLAEIKAKEDLESALADSKHKLQSLHSALETSEHVQRDFVRLSQALQVELEEVRQEREKERRSDAETSSVQSLDLATPGGGGTSNQSGDDGSAPRTPALSPELTKKQETK